MNITVDIQREDYAAFCKYVMDTKIRKKYFWTMFFIFTVLVILINLLQNQRPVIIAAQVVIFTVLFLIISRITRWLNGILTRSLPLKDGAVLGKKEYEITDEGLKCSHEKGSGITKWSAFRSVEQTKTHTILFIDSMMGFIIPHRAFATPEAKDAFVDEVKARIPK